MSDSKSIWTMIVYRPPIPSTPTRSGSLFTLPLELREHVYSFVFDDTDIKTVHLLTSERPQGSLRLASRAIFLDTAKEYERATRRFDIAREAAIADTLSVSAALLNGWIEGESDYQIPTILSKMAEKICIDVEEGEDHYSIVRCAHMRERPAAATCPHKFLWILSKACHQCTARYLLAVHCFSHPDDNPRLVKPDGSGQLTEAGKKFDDLERRRGMEYIGEYSKRWWMFELRKQRQIDSRCRIRRDAIRELVESGCSPRDTQYNEEMIREVENRMSAQALEVWKKFTYRIYGRNPNWMDEYRQRQRRWAEEAEVSGEQLSGWWLLDLCT